MGDDHKILKEIAFVCVPLYLVDPRKKVTKKSSEFEEMEPLTCPHMAKVRPKSPVSLNIRMNVTKTGIHLPLLGVRACSWKCLKDILIDYDVVVPEIPPSEARKESKRCEVI